MNQRQAQQKEPDFCEECIFRKNIPQKATWPKDNPVLCLRHYRMVKFQKQGEENQNLYKDKRSKEAIERTQAEIAFKSEEYADAYQDASESYDHLEVRRMQNVGRHKQNKDKYDKQFEKEYQPAPETVNALKDYNWNPESHRYADWYNKRHPSASSPPRSRRPEDMTVQEAFDIAEGLVSNEELSRSQRETRQKRQHDTSALGEPPVNKLPKVEEKLDFVSKQMIELMGMFGKLNNATKDELSKMGDTCLALERSMNKVQRDNEIRFQEIHKILDTKAGKTGRKPQQDTNTAVLSKALEETSLQTSGNEEEKGSADQ